MSRQAVSILAVLGAVLLAAVTLQPQPWSVASSDSTTTESTASKDAAAESGATLPAVTPGAESHRVRAARRPPRDVTPELIERWLQVAEEVDPVQGRQLREMCHNDPEQFHRVMRQTGRSIIGLAELKADDPELYELKIAELRIESQVNAAMDALTQTIASGDEQQIAAREEDLRRWLRMQVLHSIRARGDYILRLKQHVQRLEQELAHEAENFEQTVERRFQAAAARSRAVASTGDGD